MNTVEKHALIERFLPLANKLAYSKKKFLPRHIDIEELKSAAYLGLVEAASRYDEQRSAFSTFAYPRISGSINDYLRSLGYFKVSLDSENDVDGNCLNDTVKSRPDHDNNFEEILEIATKDLGENAEDMLRCYCIDNLSMKEIGGRFDLTEGRISQLFSSYRKKIRTVCSRDEFVAYIAA